MGDWEQQLHGFPSSALSFLEKETGAAAPSPFQCVSVLSLRAVELCTLKKVQLLLLFILRVPRAEESERRRFQADRGNLFLLLSSCYISFTNKQDNSPVQDNLPEVVASIIIPAPCSPCFQSPQLTHSNSPSKI